MLTILNEAHQALARNNYDRAESLLRQATAFAPRDARPLALQARLYESRGQRQKAIAVFNRLVYLQPNEPTWRLARAKALVEKGEYSKAVFDFESAEAQNATLTLNDYTLFCEAAFRLGNANAVRHTLAKIEEINPSPHPRAELIRGLMAFRSGQGEQARQILLRAAAIWPDNQALTKALRRTSAVYYRNKRQLLSTNVAQATGKYTPPTTTTQTASLQLVQEFTPPLPTPPVAVRAKPVTHARSQAASSNKPGRLTIVFTKLAQSRVMSADQQNQDQPAADQIVPVGHQPSHHSSIGFRRMFPSDG